MAIPCHGQPYTMEMDHALMDEIAVYNPFKKGHSWPGLKKKPEAHSLLSLRQAKSLRDRTLLLLDRRKTQVQAQERASGIDVPPPTELDIAVDEVLLLKEEAEKEEKPKPKLLQADQKILKAAGGNETQNLKRTPSPANNCGALRPVDYKEPSQDELAGLNLLKETMLQLKVESSTPPPTKRRRPGDMAEILRLKIEMEQQVREEERKLREEEKLETRRLEENRQRQEELKQRREEERQRNVEEEKQKREEERIRRQEAEQNRLREAAREAAEKDRQLRREELEIRKRELALREKKDEAEQKERNLLLQLLVDKLKGSS